MLIEVFLCVHCWASRFFYSFFLMMEKSLSLCSLFCFHSNFLLLFMVQDAGRALKRRKKQRNTKSEQSARGAFKLSAILRYTNIIIHRNVIRKKKMSYNFSSRSANHSFRIRFSSGIRKTFFFSFFIPPEVGSGGREGRGGEKEEANAEKFIFIATPSGHETEVSSGSIVARFCLSSLQIASW